MLKKLKSFKNSKNIKSNSSNTNSTVLTIEDLSYDIIDVGHRSKNGSCSLGLTACGLGLFNKHQFFNY